MHSEVKSGFVTDTHRVGQPVRVAAARGSDGLAERLAQEIVAGFGLDRYEVICMFRLQDRSQSVHINIFRSSHEYVSRTLETCGHGYGEVGRPAPSVWPMARNWATNGSGIRPLLWIGTSHVITPPLAVRSRT